MSARSKALAIVLAALTPLTSAGAAAPAPPPAAPSEGDWDGGLQLPNGLQAPLTLHLKPAGATLDSPDQGAAGVPVYVTDAADGAVVVDVPGAKARFTGRVSPDGRTLEGSWTQGQSNLTARFARAGARRRCAGVRSAADTQAALPLPGGGGPLPRRRDGGDAGGHTHPARGRGRQGPRR